MYSTILSWDYDVGAMRELIEPISNFRFGKSFSSKETFGRLWAQHIFLLRDMPLALQNQIVEATPLPLNVEEHSVAMETVKRTKRWIYTMTILGGKIHSREKPILCLT